jgi:hypothetical protein
VPSRNFPGGVTRPSAKSDPTFRKTKQSISGLFLGFKHTTTLKQCRTNRFLQCQLVFHNRNCCFDENYLARKFRLSVSKEETPTTYTGSLTTSLNRMVERVE